MAAHSRDAARWMSGSTPVITTGLLLTLAMVFAQTASQLIDFHFFALRLRVLDSDHHRSVFGVASILAEAVAAGAIWLHAVSRRNRAGIVAAAVVGVLTVPRALESVVRAFQRYSVPILAMPLAAVFVVVCASTFRDDRRARSIVWLALSLLACSFALHGIGPQADAVNGPHTAAYTWAYQLTGIVKHGAELAGWMLLATGLIAGASPRGEGSDATGRRCATPPRRSAPVAPSS